MVAVIVSIASSIVSGMVLFFLQRYFKKKQHEDELREEKRHKRDVIVMKSISAIGELTSANSIALRDGKTNGEMKKALSEYEKAKCEMMDFLIEHSVNEEE